MQEFTVLFRTPDEIARFRSIITRMACRVQIQYEDAVFDAKSTLSMFALKLNTPVCLRVHDTEESVRAAIADFLFAREPSLSQ